MNKYSNTLTFLILFLTIVGLITIGSASVVAADRDFGNKWFYLSQQIVWATLGIAAFVFTSKIKLEFLEKHAPQFYLFMACLLVAVLIPGIGTSLLGARRWITFGSFSLQPAELAKLAIILYMGSLLKKSTDLKKFLSPLGLYAFLIMLEPDMGTTLVVVSVCLIMYFASGANLKPLVKLIPFGIILIVLAIAAAPYRLNRVKTFFDPASDPQGQSYQVRQAIIGIGSGGLFGEGLGQSRQKYEFLPEVTTDSIFAVVGEELGFIGAASLVGLYLLLVLTGVSIAKSTNDQFAGLVAIGISTWFGIQAYINISAVIALVPFTGIPLSFISYGGTSLFVNLAASGILVNAAKRQSLIEYYRENTRIHRRSSH